VPYDPLSDMANIDYTEAEDRGYVKLDFLNVHVYQEIKSEKELVELMREPNWSLLNKKEFVEQLVHLGNHYYNLQKMPEPVDSIPRLAMFLACIRPAKKHLIGKSWSEVAESVWEKTIDGYSFKKSHSVAYAQLVVVHMNYLENLNHSAN
jgi:DNA polymerase III alpha subunit